MARLNWDDFDGTRFQKFCNSLLLFEVSKFAHVYSAAGKDDGVDQLFLGNYDNKSGLWRFQDKFHHSGKKTADIAALKKDILADIIENYRNENFIVYITNVNLGTRKFTEIREAAYKQMNGSGIQACEILIWHEAAIEGLLVGNPIVFHWFWEKETALLQPFGQYFSNQLRTEIPDERNQLKNDFFGRAKELSELSSFIADNTKSALAIVANGGYGKTRLAIECFKNDIALLEDWVPLVMSHIGFYPTTFLHLLKSGKRLLIFIDNAHEIPEVVSEVKRLIDNTHGKNKLLLTSRPALFSEITMSIPSHGRNIEKLVLGKLSYEETKQMFKHEMPWLPEMQVISLTEISKGVPNVILELIRLVRLGKKPNEISAEGVFNEGVQQIFQEAIADIETKAHIPKEKAYDFLRLISLISPVTNSQAQRDFISEVIGLRLDKLDLLINEFVALNLLESGQAISIKPDPYSDSILVETLKKNISFVDRVKNYQGAETYLENILKNLSEAEMGDHERQYFINGLLDGYVRLLDDPATPARKVHSIYKFMEGIAVFKPVHSVFVLRRFFSLQQKTSIIPIIGDVQDSAYKILSSLCTYSHFAKDNKGEMFALVEGFIKLSGNYKLVGDCYSFHEWNFPYFKFRPRQCCENQLFLKDKIVEYLANGSMLNIEMGLAAAKTLLALEFELEKFYEPATMQIHFGHGQVPYCSHIKQIRTDTIQALVTFYENPLNAPQKENVLDMLLGYFFYASLNAEKQFKQDLAAEISTVFDFMNRLLDTNPPPYLKNKILAKIQIFESVGFKEPFQNIVPLLKTKAQQTNSLWEELEMNLRNEDYFDVKANLEARILKLVTQYGSFKSFQADLLHIRSRLNEQNSNFRTILSILSHHFPSEARDLLTLIQQKHENLMMDAVFLIGDAFKDEVYFYSIIHWLWDRIGQHLYTFFWLLSWGRNRDRQYYKEADLDYYEYLVDHYQELNNVQDYLNYNLIDYAYLNRQRTFYLLDKYFKLAHVRDLDHINFAIFDKKEHYEADFVKEIQALFYNNTDKIELGGTHHQFLYFLEANFGFDELFLFVSGLIEAALLEDKYRYFDFDRQFYKSPSLTEEQNVDRFIKILNWYVNNYEINSKKQDFVISMFKPSLYFTKKIQQAVVDLAGFDNPTDQKLINIGKGLQCFTRLNEEWINTVASIADKIKEEHALQSTFTQIFGSAFYANNGSKSKVGIGVPYSEDLAKKEMLEKVIGEKTFNPSVIHYLEKCLANVEADIAREINDDKDATSF